MVARKQQRQRLASGSGGDGGERGQKGQSVEREQDEAVGVPADKDEDDDETSGEETSEEEEEYDSNDNGDDDDEEDQQSDSDSASASDDASEGGFEEQGSSDEDEDLLVEQARADDQDSDDGLEILDMYDDDPRHDAPRSWRTAASTSSKRAAAGRAKKKKGGNKDDTATKKGSDEGGRKQQERAGEKAGGDDDDPAAKAGAAALWMHTDDLSSDDEDEDGTSNRIGRVPLHWYDDYDHVGYDAHGGRVIKQSGGRNGVGGKDLLDEAIRRSDDVASNKFTVHDALNARDVELTPRQVELVRRIQSGAYAHPEHDGNAEYVDYYSGVDKEISGINADRHPPKARFQPSKWEKLQVRRLLHRLKCGSINMDFLEGKVRDMNDLIKSKDEETDAPRLLWKGDEEDELARSQHIAAPKASPPGHAESYIPPDEYLPTEQDLREWDEMDVKERPHGLLVPRKHPNLRSVGSYPHSVRERFERCLDLYLCPRAMKRRLNIDPESLVPSIPRAADLRPFPTARAVQYETPIPEGQEVPPMIRCLAVSPDGQFLASGASDGFVRLWEVQTSRLLRSWDVSSLVGGDAGESSSSSSSERAEPKPVVALEWNPNRSHHCLLAAVGKCAVVIATGTGGADDAELTEALLSAAVKCKGGGNIKNARAAKAVSWVPLEGKQKKGTTSSSASSAEYPISAFGGLTGPICALRTNKEVASLKWHRKGDYFVTVCPKAGASAVLIHQLSKASSQQPFSKAKGEVQCACFHPNKPFLFVASQQHVRVYHLIKQTMVKRLLSGCRWISSIDVHPSGDHVIVGSLDRRMVWFDLDLSDTPYKTLKYHERALRSVSFHPRYPLMASSSDDGTVHIFHGMVYSDLMRNPLIVPVKILRGHQSVNKLGVLASVFHPTQPWLFSAGADGKIHLYQDI